MMYDTALKIQRLDFTHPNAAAVITQLEEVLGYFDQHAHHEDNHILPPIQKYEATLVDDFEKQHVEDHRLAADLNQFIAGWKTAISAEKKREIGSHIFYSFNEFIGFNLYHMNKEEDLLNAVLWKNYTDPELMQITQKIIANIKPESLMAQSRWMMRSINRQELLAWLGGIKATAPAPVFAAFTQMAKEELPETEWLEVKAILFEDVLTA
jgi:Hemerythrin HHE cation binding domain